MRYPIKTDTIIDVTKPPYCADNTGKKDCTEILRRVAMAGGKVVASMLDSAEATYTLEISEADQSLSITLNKYAGTKNEQGDSYNMVAYGGAIAEWYAQAQAFANATVGKTAAEIDSIDATAVAGCTIYAGGYKAALVRAAGYVR